MRWAHMFSGIILLPLVMFYLLSFVIWLNLYCQDAKGNGRMESNTTSEKAALVIDSGWISMAELNSCLCYSPIFLHDLGFWLVFPVRAVCFKCIFLYVRTFWTFQWRCHSQMSKHVCGHLNCLSIMSFPARKVDLLCSLLFNHAITKAVVQ